MVKSAKPKTKATTTTKTTKKKVAAKPVKVAAKRPAPKKAAAANQPFFTFQFTDQSLYWFIFGAASIAFALWVYSLDAKVRDLYDQVDISSYSAEVTPNTPDTAGTPDTAASIEESLVE